MAKTTTKEASIRDIVKYAKQDLSPNQIASRLNGDGLTTSGGRRWYDCSVILRMRDAHSEKELKNDFPKVHAAGLVYDAKKTKKRELEQVDVLLGGKSSQQDESERDAKQDARARIVELASTGIAPDLIWTIMSHENRKMDNGRKWTKSAVVEVLTEMARPAKAKANGKAKAKSEPSPVETWTVVVVVGHVATVRVASSFEDATKALLADETDGASARKVIPLGDVPQCLMGLDVLSVERR